MLLKRRQRSDLTLPGCSHRQTLQAFIAAGGALAGGWRAGGSPGQALAPAPHRPAAGRPTGTQAPPVRPSASLRQGMARRARPQQPEPGAGSEGVACRLATVQLLGSQRSTPLLRRVCPVHACPGTLLATPAPLTFLHEPPCAVHLSCRLPLQSSPAPLGRCRGTR